MLQKQFRPPINKVVIEVPAGLVDAGEGAAESAVRELKEETGYVGTVDKDGWGVGCVMFNGTLPPVLMIWGGGEMGFGVGAVLLGKGGEPFGRGVILLMWVIYGRSGILQYES